ncbi:molybdopterin-dependent oxidoreductase [Sphingomonas sp. TX0543]|uniref:molybdopterin-dependent oxidoreductase n=2 Tax=Pseudomonadota TaxID=1224 RepID=UPI0010F44EFA|nr:molybdopterin-dependent oxidoreductase [Sphingomonas sp. 3P27F8]
MPELKKSACILCYINCGIEAEVADGKIVKVRGDADNPKSKGYICQKAARLPFYNNTRGLRLTKPLRKNKAGGFDEIEWDVAIEEIAARLNAHRAAHPGHGFGYVGGGGQGNVLGGPFGQALCAVMGKGPYFNALSQEKTGDFWVNGRLFGSQACHTAEDVHHAELTVVLGCNPWMAHGFPRARDAMSAIKRDDSRKLIVIDPRRTEVADIADLHLALRPGTDAFLLAALLAMIVRRGGADEHFLQEHATGWDEVRAMLLDVPVDAWLEAAQIDRAQAEAAADMIVAAESMSVRVDVGMQQARNSTLNSYFEKLLFLVTGNFARRGCNGLHSWLAPMWRNSPPAEIDEATGQVRIGGISPLNDLPTLIEADHDHRIRTMVVDSSNPANTASNTAFVEKALSSLDMLVVIEVAMTETARLADYVLPAANQFEKCETTLFSFDYPENTFHLRRPLFAPLPGTLPEPEIYVRLLRAMGVMPPQDKIDALRAVATNDRPAFGAALAGLMRENPAYRKIGAAILYETLGQTLPAGLEAGAVFWSAAHQCAAEHAVAVKRAGIDGEGAALGEAIFTKIMESPSGFVFSEHEYDEVLGLIRHADGKIHLAIPEMLEWVDRLDPAQVAPDPAFPFMLIGGQRRHYNANQVIRDPRWRKNDPNGALQMHPHDLARVGGNPGDWMAVSTITGRVVVRVETDERLRIGQVALPHGYGQIYDTVRGAVTIGPRLNMLTTTDDCDPIARTPYHKNVAVQVELPTAQELRDQEEQDVRRSLLAEALVASG